MAPMSQRSINMGYGKGYSKQVGLIMDITSVSYCRCGTGPRLIWKDIDIRVYGQAPTSVTVKLMIYYTLL